MIQFSDSFIRFIFLCHFRSSHVCPLCHFSHDFHHLMMFVRFKSLFDVVNVDRTNLILICNVSLLSDCHIGCLFACDLIKCDCDCHLDWRARYIQCAYEWEKRTKCLVIFMLVCVRTRQVFYFSSLCDHKWKLKAKRGYIYNIPLTYLRCQVSRHYLHTTLCAKHYFCSCFFLSFSLLFFFKMFEIRCHKLFGNYDRSSIVRISLAFTLAWKFHFHLHCIRISNLLSKSWRRLAEKTIKAWKRKWRAPF